jgi:hypothetical protein
MIKTKLIYPLLSIMLLGTTCEENHECHKSIMIVNNSSQAIYVQGETHYPDTLYFGHYSGLTSNPEIFKVQSNSSSNEPLQRRDCYEDIFNYGVEIPSGILMVYIFDAEVLESTPWSTVVNDYMVLKRFDLSLQNLKDSNWTITYP